MRFFRQPILVAALLGALGAFATTVSESASLTVDLDTRVETVRTVPATNAIPAVAVNSATDWRSGGDGSKTSVVRVVPVGGDAAADPSTWQDCGATSTVASVAGESAEVWQPTVRHLYRMELVTDGTVCETAYLDASEASDLDEKTSIAGFTVQVTPSSIPCTGHPLTPALTVTDGATALVSGRDYVSAYSNNFYAGTACVSVYGVGAYGGTATTTFTVTAPPVTTVHESQRDITLDTRSVSVRKLMTICDLYAIAWNGAADWRKGGDGETAATVAVTQATATDPTDPTTWTPAGEPAAITNGVGEGTVAWLPVKRGYYLVSHLAGSVAWTNCFDLSETAELSSGKPISEFTVVLSDEAFVCSGYLAEPSVTVSNGTVTLVRDTDYSLAYSDNFYSGTAKVTVTGIGDYEGTVEKTYVILPSPEVSLDEASASAALDTRTNAVLTYGGRTELRPFAFVWNSAADWVLGGSNDVTATVSYAPLADVADEPEEEEFVTIASGQGAGTVSYRGPRGLIRARLRRSDDPSGTEALVRTIRIGSGPGLVILVR